jgi:hypothetical protein
MASKRQSKSPASKPSSRSKPRRECNPPRRSGVEGKRKSKFSRPKLSSKPRRERNQPRRFGVEGKRKSKSSRPKLSSKSRRKRNPPRRTRPHRLGVGPLPAQHRRFGKLYRVTLNARRSSLRAGFSAKHGYFLLDQPVIRQYIATLNPEEIRKELQEEEEKEKQHGGDLITRPFVEDQLADLILTAETHEKRGDADRVSAIKLAAEVAGCISPVSGRPSRQAPIIEGEVQASAAQYLPKWIRDQRGYHDPRSEQIEREFRSLPEASVGSKNQGPDGGAL